LDYNAAWQGLMAYQVINLKTVETNGTNDTNNTNDTNDTNNTNESNNNNNNTSAGAEQIPEKANSFKIESKTIAGIVCGIIGLFILASAAWKRSLIFEWFKERLDKIINIRANGGRNDNHIP
jgi:hypothetical protein